MSEAESQAGAWWAFVTSTVVTSAVALLFFGDSHCPPRGAFGDEVSLSCADADRLNLLGWPVWTGTMLTWLLVAVTIVMFVRAILASNRAGG